MIVQRLDRVLCFACICTVGDRFTQRDDNDVQTLNTLALCCSL